jgi:hypothetical protein
MVLDPGGPSAILNVAGEDRQAIAPRGSPRRDDRHLGVSIARQLPRRADSRRHILTPMQHADLPADKGIAAA